MLRIGINNNIGRRFAKCFVCMFFVTAAGTPIMSSLLHNVTGVAAQAAPQQSKSQQAKTQKVKAQKSAVQKLAGQKESVKQISGQKAGAPKAGSGSKTPTPKAPTAKAQPVAQKLGPYTENIPGTLVKFDMVPIPGGTITVADPAKKGATRKVNIKPFWIEKTETTWDEFDIFAFRLDWPDQQKPPAGEDATSRPSKPYGAPDHGFGHAGYPALSMTYLSAYVYCIWLSRKTGKNYRLPTEAEWEYACRAGATGQEMIDQKTFLEDHAWYWENAEDKTHPVANKKPIEWGLYDMLGNAGEWCEDLSGKPVLCGGSQRDKADKVHCGARAYQTPEWNQTDPQNPKSRWWLSDGKFVGFRVVCDPSVPANAKP